MDFAVHIGGQGCRLDGVGKFGEEHSRVHVVGCDQDYTGDGQRLSLRAYAAKHSKGGVSARFAAVNCKERSGSARLQAGRSACDGGRRWLGGVEHPCLPAISQSG
ncbi:hypothetical protein GCM10022206_71640 [Streptomyces chiangmaiensis]